MSDIWLPSDNIYAAQFDLRLEECVFRLSKQKMESLKLSAETETLNSKIESLNKILANLRSKFAPIISLSEWRKMKEELDFCERSLVIKSGRLKNSISIERDIEKEMGKLVEQREAVKFKLFYIENYR